MRYHFALTQKRHGQSSAEFPNVDSRINQNSKIDWICTHVVPFLSKSKQSCDTYCDNYKKNQEDSPLYEKMFDAWW